MNTAWVQLRWALPVWLIGLLCSWLPDNRVACRLRGTLLRPFLRSCGRNFQVGARVTLLNTFNLSIGDDVYLATGAWMNALAGLTIEREVVVGPYVVISTMQHVFRNGSVRFGGSVGSPVRIGRGSWLAAHAVVKCGTTIGSGCLVAANCAVIRDVPPNSIIAGVPGRVVGVNRDSNAGVADRTAFLRTVGGEPDPEAGS